MSMTPTLIDAPDWAQTKLTEFPKSSPAAKLAPAPPWGKQFVFAALAQWGLDSSYVCLGGLQAGSWVWSLHPPASTRAGNPGGPTANSRQQSVRKISAFHSLPDAHIIPGDVAAHQPHG